MKLYISNLVFGHESLVEGVIYWNHENWNYPDSSWIDNANVLLGWWLGALMHLADGEVNESFTFMEGPHKLMLSRVDTGQIEVGVESGDFHAVVPLVALAEEVLQGGHRLYSEANGKSQGGLNYQGFLRAERILRKKLEQA